jgi:20S proteasome subunit beta 1
VHVAATLFETICYANKSALTASVIVAGWDKEAGPSVYSIPLGGGLFRQPWAISGSGSTYVYGYCDATFKDGWGRDETVQFVKNSKRSHPFSAAERRTHTRLCAALALAMSRDGSSGGVIRMAVITEDGVERLFVPGNELPTFWDGLEVLGKPAKQPSVVPMTVESL